MKYALMWITLVAVCVVLVGCGGRSGTDLFAEKGDAVTPPGDVITPLSDQIRQMEPGDEWDYNVQGTATDGEEYWEPIAPPLRHSNTPF